MFYRSNTVFENKLSTKVYCDNITRMMFKKDGKSRQQWLTSEFVPPDSSFVVLAKIRLQMAGLKRQMENAHGTTQITRGSVLFLPDQTFCLRSKSFALSL